MSFTPLSSFPPSILVFHSLALYIHKLVAAVRAVEFGVSFSAYRYLSTNNAEGMVHVWFYLYSLLNLLLWREYVGGLRFR